MKTRGINQTLTHLSKTHFYKAKANANPSFPDAFAIALKTRPCQLKILSRLAVEFEPFSLRKIRELVH